MLNFPPIVIFIQFSHIRKKNTRLFHGFNLVALLFVHNTTICSMYILSTLSILINSMIFPIICCNFPLQFHKNVRLLISLLSKESLTFIPFSNVRLLEEWTIIWCYTTMHFFSLIQIHGHSRVLLE